MNISLINMIGENNNVTLVAHSVAEQQPHGNNQQNENPVDRQLSPQGGMKTVNTTKKGPMNPTRLEYSCWQTRPKEAVACVFVMFVFLTIIVGVLTVYFTAIKPMIPSCQLKFTSTSSDPVDYNYGLKSVAVGHFNNDTWLDFVVANHLANQIAIFLNYGNRTFARSRLYSTGPGSTPYMVTVGDFNNDHQLDIVVANFDVNSIGVFLGFGDGSFANQIETITGSSRPWWITVADLNEDTRLDLVTADYGTQSVSVLYGYGNGHFADPIRYSTDYDSLPSFVIAKDFNNDNQLDLAVTNYGTNNVGIFLANNNGSFANQIISSTGAYSGPCSLAVGHFNNDDLLDIAVATHGTNNIGVLLGYGNGSFASPTYYALGTASPYSIGVGDFNRDNRSDLVVTSYGTENIAVLLGNDNSTFSRLKTYSTGSLSSISVIADDFNNDNRLDIIVISNDTDSIDILFGIDEGFPYQTMYSAGYAPQYAAVADVNNDTHLDIVVSNSGEDDISVLLGYGNGSFANQITYGTYDSGGSVVIGDFNNDSRLDVAIALPNDRYVNVLLGCGNGSFVSQTISFIEIYPGFVVVGDINNDNQLDLVGVASNEAMAAVLLGYGNGSFAYPVTYAVGDISYSAAVGDFNNDNALDVVTVNSYTSGASILLGYGNGSFRNQVTYATGTWPYSVAVSDLNKDAQLDIIVANSNDHTVSVLLGYGDGSFANQMTFTTGTQPYSVAIADLNNDTVPDISVANFADNNVTVLIGYGNGSFANSVTYATGVEPYSVTIGDFNEDTRPDLIVVNQGSNSISVLLHYDSGALGNEMTFAPGIGSRLQYIMVGDVNRDNNSDLIIANYGTNSVGVLLGYGDGTFEIQRVFSTGTNTHPYSIAMGNFNEDDELDVAVLNYGTRNIGILLNNGMGMFALQSSNEPIFNFTPHAITAGDLNNDGQWEIILAYDDTDHVDIFITYDSGMFMEQKTYSTGWSPSYVAVGDFNKDTQLDLAVANGGVYGGGYSSPSSIGILLGYGNGSFANQITYVIYGSPSFMTVGDFNNDNELDIIFTVYGISNISVLLGYGNSSFTNPIIYDCGYSLEFLAVGDFNNDKNLDVVGTLDGTNLIILLGCGNGTFTNQKGHSYSSTNYPLVLAVGDFNSDNCLDIVAVNENYDTIGIFLGYGNGSFAHQNNYLSDSYANLVSVVVGDLNNDDRLDIVVADKYFCNVDIYLGYGNGSFAIRTTYSFSAVPGFIALGDFNKDGRLDIAVHTYDGSNDWINILLGQGNGFFENGMTCVVGEHTYSMGIGDFNKDNRLDIVVTNDKSNNVGILLGYANQATAYKMTLITGEYSRPQSFVISDFNLDNRMDIAVANSGSNCIGIFFGYSNYSFTEQITHDTGSGSSPSSIATGYFNKDNYLDIVVANYGNNNIGILFGGSNGSFSNQKTITTGTQSQPHSVAVGDFNNDALLDIIVANFGINEIGIFINQGDGTFADMLVISIDYGSYPFSVVVSDFDNNKKLDFAVANNGTDNLKVFLQIC